MAHFMLSLVLLTNAVVLFHRAGFEDGPPDQHGRVRPVGPASPLVPVEHLIMGWLLLVAASMVIFLGTVVTSTGPHGGDPTARRLELSLHDVARLHSGAVLLFLGLTVVTLWRMVRAGAPPEVIRRGEVLLLVLLGQGAVGYLQYFSGVPTWLVAIHVALASVLWVVTLQFVLGLTTRTAAATVGSGAAGSGPVTAGAGAVTAGAGAGAAGAGAGPGTGGSTTGDSVLAPA